MHFGGDYFSDKCTNSETSMAIGVICKDNFNPGNKDAGCPIIPHNIRL